MKLSPCQRPLMSFIIGTEARNCQRSSGKRLNAQLTKTDKNKPKDSTNASLEIMVILLVFSSTDGRADFCVGLGQRPTQSLRITAHNIGAV